MEDGETKEQFKERMRLRYARRIYEKVRDGEKKPVIRTAEERLTRSVEREVNKKSVQVLVIEKFQMYCIELSKALAMHENRHIVDAIFYDGLERDWTPFINRIMKREPTDKPLILEEPVVKPSRNYLTDRYFIPWQHNVRVPAFITYSSMPFMLDGNWHRLIDIDWGEESEGDDNQIRHYIDNEEFTHFYKMICEKNLVAEKIGKQEPEKFRKLLLEGAKAIEDTLGKENIYHDIAYTGKGFRVIVKYNTVKEMGTEIDKWKKKDLVCVSSTHEYQAQKLYSFKSRTPHFQTECSPRSKYFRYSNPSFFFIRIDEELRKLLYEYFQTYKKTHYKEKVERMDYQNIRDYTKKLYETMVEEQKCMEALILEKTGMKG
jgi:hypothetical protein